MKTRVAIFSALMLLACLGLLHAEEPSAIPPDQVVGSVYGKAITAGDVGLTAPIDALVQFDARDTARWQLMSRIAQAFGKPIADRFIEEHKIDATAEEIAGFKKSMHEANQRRLLESEKRLAEVKAELAEPDLRDEDREKLQQEQEQLERHRPHLMKPSVENGVPDALARQMIVPWKTERELHRIYGGRVIFQQFGPEALDARKRLYEEAENKGDLKFDDPGVRHLFYYYSNMKHTVIDDDKALERPWFATKEK